MSGLDQDEKQEIIQFTDNLTSHMQNTTAILRLARTVRSARFVDRAVSFCRVSRSSRKIRVLIDNIRISQREKYFSSCSKHSTTEQTFDMTKLTEWLTGLAVFFGIYWILVTRKVSNQFTEDFFFHIQISPIVAVLLLGVSWVD